MQTYPLIWYVEGFLMFGLGVMAWPTVTVLYFVFCISLFQRVVKTMDELLEEMYG